MIAEMQWSRAREVAELVRERSQVFKEVELAGTDAGREAAFIEWKRLTGEIEVLSR